jgi:uncharacterized repeat protein (TIGR01451 family)
MGVPRLLLIPFLLVPSLAQVNPQLPVRPVASASLVDQYGRLPMAFEANHGQWDPRVAFLARGSGYELFLTPDETVFELRPGGVHDPRNNRPQSGSQENSSRSAAAVLRMKLAGANIGPQVIGVEELPGSGNYFIGNDPKKWATNVPTYRKVEYKSVYPGVDLVYYGAQGQLEYDFVIAPRGDPARIALTFEGAQPTLTASGELLLRMSGGDVHFRRPVAYQKIGGSKHLVDGHYALGGSDSVRFEIGDYDHNRALVIDPVLAYSTYLGGTDNDVAWAIAMDSAGNAYVTGQTYSVDFPVKNPIENYHTGGNCSATGQCFDVFVTKLNSSGSTLVYSTYLGGINDDIGYGIAVDSAGNAYVAGATASDDFPTTPGVLRAFCGELFVNGKPTSTCNSNGHVPDGFVTKLNSTGSAIDYSTFIGGTGFDHATAIAVDAAGEAYVVGVTNGPLPTGNSNDPGFPLTTTAFQSTYPGGGYTTFFVKLNAIASSEVYGSLLGSPTAQAPSYATGIAIDSSGDGYMSGYTGNKDFPTTLGAFQTTCKPGSSVCNGYFGIVAKFDPTKDAAPSLVYSTYLGGSTPAAQDKPFGIAVDSAGDAYVTGPSNSSDFPTTKGAFQTVCTPVGGACSTTFVTKFNATGTGLVYSTFLGNQPVQNFATNTTQGFAIHLDSAKHAYVTGSVVDTTGHLSFPVVNPVASYVSGNDVFVSEFNPSGKALLFSTYLGGTGNDYGQGISVGSAGNIYVAGQTSSADFPTTTGAFQTVFHGPDGGGTDAFVSRIALTAADMAVTNSAPGSVTSGSNLTYTIVATNDGPDTASSVKVTDKTPTGTTFVSVSTTLGSCTAPPVGGKGTVTCKVSSLAKASSFTVTLVVKVTAVSGSTLNDTATVTSAAFDPNTANNTAKAGTKVQ